MEKYPWYSHFGEGSLVSCSHPVQDVQAILQDFQATLQNFEAILQDFEAILQDFEAILQDFQAILQDFQAILPRKERFREAFLRIGSCKDSIIPFMRLFINSIAYCVSSLRHSSELMKSAGQLVSCQ